MILWPLHLHVADLSCKGLACTLAKVGTRVVLLKFLELSEESLFVMLEKQLFFFHLFDFIS